MSSRRTRLTSHRPERELKGKYQLRVRCYVVNDNPDNITRARNKNLGHKFSKEPLGNPLGGVPSPVLDLFVTIMAITIALRVIRERIRA